LKIIVLEKGVIISNVMNDEEEKMKRLWLVLLSLGLIMAFSASAFAVDVKVSADYSVGGLYLNKIAVDDGFQNWAGKTGSENPSTAFFYQRLRIGTDFVVSPCLKLVTKFDAMDRIWGGARSAADASNGGWAYNPATLNTGGVAGTRAESENIVMDLAYIEYTSPIGLFKVGYQPDFVFGTVFGDRGNGMPTGQIQYVVPVGPVYLFAILDKEASNSASAVSTQGTPLQQLNASVTDRNFDYYEAGAIYGFGKKIEAGAVIIYGRNAENRGLTEGAYLVNAYNVVPYFKAQIGPVALQGELNYGFGDAIKGEGMPGGTTGLGTNVSINTLSVFLDATDNLGMVYVGGSFAYVSGQDPNKTDQVQQGAGNTGGLDWIPCLILFNTDLDYWAGNVVGHSGSVVNGEMQNAWFFQGRVGVKPTPKLDTMLSISYAVADQKSVLDGNGPLGYGPTPGGTYGTEVDLTGTYKITNNLSYMLGAGYLFAGDYFKGADTGFAGGAKVTDDFIFINKLTLSF
jgi:hypothetical protein